MTPPSRSIPISKRQQCYFDFDEYCDLLGGANWERAVESRLQSGVSSVRHKALNPLAGFFTSSNQFLFVDPRCRPSSLEILWLKWNVFSALCREVLSFHQEKQRPHLSIMPSTVRITIPSPMSAALPARWVFDLALDRKGIAKPVSRQSMPSDFAQRIFNPNDRADNIFSVPMMSEKPLGYEVKGTALVRSIERIRDDKSKTVSAIIELHFLSSDIRPGDFSENDVFFVDLDSHDESVLPIQVWASMKTPLEKGILLKGTSNPLKPEEWTRFKENHQTPFSRSKISIFKSYQAPCDLYSLGMLLFGMLLSNSEQDLKIVDQGVHHFAECLKPMVQGLGLEDFEILTKRFQDRFLEYGVLFSQKSIRYDPTEEALSGNVIPDEIWSELLVFAFRLVTFIPQFSFSRNHGDVQIERSHRLMETVLALADRFSSRIKIAFFGSEARDREILETCQSLREELNIKKVEKDAV